MQKKKNLTIYPLPAFLNNLPLIPYTTEEFIGCTNEMAKGTNRVARNLPSYFLFQVLLF